MEQVQTIHDVAERFQTNWQGFFHRYKILITLTIFATVADMLSTIYFMHIEGVSAESHPMFRMLSLFLGPTLGPIVGKLWQLTGIGVLTVYMRRWAFYIFFAVIILYTWAAWYNLWGHYLYYPV